MKKIISTLLTVLTVAVASAQNIDPTVEVSRQYEGKLMEVHKPSLDMAVPDTLHRFDLDFDYSVFENPYKGTYDFNPYILEMRPSASEDTARSLYLRAGAGYTLHPVFDILWSPLKNGPFSVDVYGTHRSYIGRYLQSGQGSEWDGYDLLSKAGVDLSYDWKKSSLNFGASYYGIADKNPRRDRTYNAVDAYALIKSKAIDPNNFRYNLSATYRFAEENTAVASYSYLSEHNMGIEASFGPGFGDKGRVLFDVGVKMAFYTGALDSSAGIFCFSPHYVYNKGILRLDAGLGISARTSSGASFATKGQLIYPDISLNLDLIPNALRFYIKAGGGERLNTYSSLLETNSHIDLTYCPGSPAAVMDVTVERLSADIGFEGRITSFFSYKLEGGYADYRNALFDAIAYDGGTVLPAAGYAPFRKYHASLEMNLDIRSFRLDGAMVYVYADGITGQNLIGPAAFEGDVSFGYDWNGRIQAGIDCGFASSRSSLSGFVVPGFADLGIYAEYAFSRKLSAWLRGGNLLNMEIQRNLLFAEKGVNFTAGICLNL